MSESRAQKPFVDFLIERIVKTGSVLCLGVDPQVDYIARAAPELFDQFGLPILPKHEYEPDHWPALATVFQRFCMRAIGEALGEICAIKGQSAFWEFCGPPGMDAQLVVEGYAWTRGLAVIRDGKRNDGGDSAQAYADSYLGPHSLCHALTINPSIGLACLDPFVANMKEFNKGGFPLVRTSFKPASEFEQVPVIDREGFERALTYARVKAGMIGLSGQKIMELLDAHTAPHWHLVAKRVAELGQTVMGERGWSSLGAVVGATSQESIVARQLMPNTWFLVPGFGAQGGAADDAVLGADENGFGITVNSSRGLMYPKDGNIAAAARQARKDLNDALRRAGKGKAFL